MEKMTTISAKITVEEKMRFQQMAKDKNITVSTLIKQIIKMGKYIDSNEMDRLEELNLITHYIDEIREYCFTTGIIDKQLLLAMLRFENACKNI